MRRDVQLKAEQIARLVVQNVPKTKIAIEMGMSYDGILRITKLEEYLAIEDEVRATLLGQMDARLQKRADLRQQMADEMEDDAVPEAFKIMLEQLRKKRDLKTALEILDRDPKRQFARTAQKPIEDTSQPARVPMDKSVLQEAVKEADKTFDILQRNANQQKPAEA